MASAVRTVYPGMQIVALGTLAEPESALAALRAGVRDFIDLSAPAEDALRITRQVIDQDNHRRGGNRSPAAMAMYDRAARRARHGREHRWPRTSR